MFLQTWMYLCHSHTTHQVRGASQLKKKKSDRSRKQDNAFNTGTVGRQNITPYTALCTHKKSVQLYKLLWLWLYKCHNHFLASSAKQVQQVLQG